MEATSPSYKYDYKVAVQNILTYLKSVGIQHDCLLTDALATLMPMGDARWLATGAPEDLFYMRSYCGVPDYDVVPLEAELMTRLRKKYPIKKGLTPETRFPIVAKRVKFAEQALISSYTFVVVFGKAFKVRSTEEDGRAILRINEKQFYTSLSLSGSEVPINDFMQVPYANQCLSDWGKYSG